MLPIFRNEDITQVTNTSSDSFTSEKMVSERLICPDRTYLVHNNAIKTAANHFRLPDACFSKHGVWIGAATAQFSENEYVSAIELAGR